MRKTITIVAALAAFSLLSCAAAPPAQLVERPEPETLAAEAAPGPVSLFQAIEEVTESLSRDLPAESRVTVLAFESENAGFSDFVIGELIAGLVNRRVIVTDRQHLEVVLGELDFQTTGLVSDETASSIGRFLGTGLVITGQFWDLGAVRRLALNVIDVESAVTVNVLNVDVLNDAALRTMISALSR